METSSRAGNSDPLTIKVPDGFMWHGQLRHVLMLAVLLPGAWAIAGDSLGDGSFLGVTDEVWFIAAIAVPVVQQLAVALLWRAQLCNGLLTRVFGDAGFTVWGIIFFPLLVARPLLVVSVGLSDVGSLPIPHALGIALGSVLVLPAVWTMHSVKKYFGFARALGGDHFFERYRTMPMVREGAFKYSSNAMYAFVFLGLWGIALLCRSRAALAVAMFQHAYIWVHWYCTEQPDGVVLYGRSPDERRCGGLATCCCRSAPTRLPFGVRAFNAGLRGLGGLTPLGRALCGDELHARATKDTGLSDFGASSYRDGFDRLVDSLNREARLTALGRLIAREEIHTALTNRLRLEAHHREHPEIGAARIDRPIIIIGMGRSGTTILHELLALDPNNRTPATWEVEMPFPPPETRTYHTDPRIATTQSRLDRTDHIVPDFKKIHRMGATLPQECVRWTTGAFASLIFGISYEVPSYCDWLLDEADMTPVYAYHRRFLQLLQWKHPAQRWVLKSPGHLWSLEAMLAEYPDARLVQTHRDPLKTNASLASLVTHLRVMASDEVDASAIARQWSTWNARALDEVVRVRRSGLIREDQIIDVSFYEFMDAPLKQVQAIYDLFGLDLSAATKQKMDAYLAAHTAEQHGGHQYRFSDFGLDLRAERERLRAYQEYFDVRSETLR